MRPSHGGLVQRGKRGMYIKRLWLREGEDPLESGYIKQNSASLVFVNPDKKISKMTFRNKDYADVAFKMPDEGFYNLFMTNREIENGVLYVSVAKNESLNHSCRAGHGDVKSKINPFYYDEAPIDIIRERRSRETFHSRITSGDVVSFTILRQGKPLPGALVKMVTQKGWAKTLKSDSEGRVAFEMIRDYYPQWHEFKRRKMEGYLAIAEYKSKDAGTYAGEKFSAVHYKVTSSGNYFPSARDYKSYLYGLLIGLFALTISGFTVYFYRRRRLKIYKEKRFG